MSILHLMKLYLYISSMQKIKTIKIDVHNIQLINPDFTHWKPLFDSPFSETEW